MKATIDIPDELYRQVKAKSALRGRRVREVAVSLFQGWIAETAEAPTTTANRRAAQQGPAWFGLARRYAVQVKGHDMDAVQRSIARGRSREGAASGGRMAPP